MAETNKTKLGLIEEDIRNANSQHYTFASLLRDMGDAVAVKVGIPECSESETLCVEFLRNGEGKQECPSISGLRATTSSQTFGRTS